MATMRSGEIITKLEPHGWKTLPLMIKGEMVCGDPSIVDPVTGKVCDLYEAEEIHDARMKKEVQADSLQNTATANPSS